MTGKLAAAVFVIVAVVALGGASAVRAEECGSCARDLTLSRAEWQCLKPRLERYLQEPVEPVIASVMGCDVKVSQSPADTVVKLDPDLRPKVAADQPDAQSARRVFFLTNGQIRCLQGRIDGLIAAAGTTPAPTTLAPCLP